MKGLNFLKRINSWVVYMILTAIVFGISVSSFLMINQLRKQEIQKVNLIATAFKAYTDGDISADPKIQDLYLAVMQDNNNLPVIRTDKNKKLLESKNVSEDILKDSIKLKAKMTEMESKYPPFEIQLPDFNNQYLYYDNSELMNYLRYYPFLLAFFISFYLIFSFWFLRLLKKTDEGFVWAGLAKETAHQIGTPLSSMIGWVEIMKLEDENSLGVKELEKDVDRLKTISERFSKIGSVPELNDLDLNETIQQNYDYLKSRISTKVHFTFKKSYEPILVPHSKILISWIVENLVKNAVDAMKGEGRLEISLYKKNRNVYIDVKDNGSGMTKQQMRNAFKPGFSTKKRGWGLGLSLTKRVIEEYHNGEVRIAQSEVGKGTTFRIILKEGQK